MSGRPIKRTLRDGNTCDFPTISAVRVTDQQRPAQAPEETIWGVTLRARWN